MKNDVVGFMAAMQDINKALLFGLETAAKTMKNWDEYPPDRREGVWSLTTVICC